MSKIDINLVKTVREATDAALHICKRALEEAKGNVQHAVEAVKKMGYAVAQKKADRPTSEGCIVAQVLSVSLKGVSRGGLLECQSETDFVSTNEMFLSFARKTLEIALTAGAKTLEELLALSFDHDQTVEQARQALIATVGENIRISRYQFLETKDHLGFYVHKNRYGCMVALQGPRPEIAKDIAVHIVVSHPNSLEELLQQDFYKDPAQRIETYLNDNQSQVLRYAYLVLGGTDTLVQ